MALDLGTVITAVEFVQKCIAIYQRIESLPQEMNRMGRRMEQLKPLVTSLESFVKKKPTTAFVTLYSGQRQDLINILVDIQRNSAQVYDLFERYEKGILSRSKSLEFRAKWMSNIWFSLIDNSPEKVQDIMDEIDYEREVLGHYLNIMAVKGVEDLHVLLLANLGADNAPPGRARRRAERLAITQSPLRSTSPSPVPPRRDYKILFVDPYNTARSVVAEALVKLFGQLTVKTGGEWRIGEVQSAGFFVKKASDHVDTIDRLDYSFKSFKKPWMVGSESPSKTPLDAVFDNKWCDHPFKKVIREEMAARTSRGLQKDMFTRFDYIIVFTNREHDNMVKLKDAIHKKGGSSRASTRSEGRVLQLGTFLNQKGGMPREILHPAGVNSDAAQSREHWNRKVAEMKTALKEFLEQEMEWRNPAAKGKPTGGQKTLEPGKA
jgi:protein-tyrosine-phosphatase